MFFLRHSVVLNCLKSVHIQYIYIYAVCAQPRGWCRHWEKCIGDGKGMGRSTVGMRGKFLDAGWGWGWIIIPMSLSRLRSGLYMYFQQMWYNVLLLFMPPPVISHLRHFVFGLFVHVWSYNKICERDILQTACRNFTKLGAVWGRDELITFWGQMVKG